METSIVCAALCCSQNILIIGWRLSSCSICWQKLSLFRTNTGTGNESYSFSFLQPTLLAQTSPTQNWFLPNSGFIDSFKSHFPRCQIKTLLCNQNTKCCFGFRPFFLDLSLRPVLCRLWWRSWCQIAPSSTGQESPKKNPSSNVFTPTPTSLFAS